METGFRLITFGTAEQVENALIISMSLFNEISTLQQIHDTAITHICGLLTANPDARGQSSDHGTPKPAVCGVNQERI